MSAIIYLLTNTINGNQYVGQTSVGLKKRWNQHCQRSRQGSTHHLHNAIRKYGADVFTMKVLECVTLDIINDREIYWIAELNTFGRGYNMTEGGEGTRGLCGVLNPVFGKTFSPEHRAKISAGKKGQRPSAETRAKLSAARRGKKFSPEHRAKLSEANKGRNNRLGYKHSSETKDKIRTANSGENHYNYGKPLSPEHRAKIKAATRAALKFRARMKRMVAPPATIHAILPV